MRKDNHTHGEAEVLEVLTDAKEVSGEVIVKEEVFDIILDLCGGFGGAVLQPRTVADLGVETLAGCQSFVFLDEREGSVSLSVSEASSLKPVDLR